MSLAHFYGWTLDYINSLSMRQIDAALSFRAEELKREAKRYGG